MDRKMIDYYPSFMQEYEEIQQICNAEQVTTSKKWSNLNYAYKQLHLSTIGKDGVERWEKTLGIIPKSDDDLETRIFRIRSKMIEDTPYTDRTLRKQLLALAGSEENYSVNIDHDNYKVSILISLKTKELLYEVEKLADRVVPAHIMLYVALKYNTHRMINEAGKTHADLSTMTHREIRESPFI